MAQVGSRLVGRDDALSILEDSSTIVIQGQQHQLPEVVEGGSNVGMGEDAGLFQVAVSEVPSWVVKGDNVHLDIRKEGGTSESQRVPGNKEGTLHPWLGGVHRANHRWVVRYHLCEPRRLEGDVLSQSLEVREVIMEEAGDLDLVLVGEGEP